MMGVEKLTRIVEGVDNVRVEVLSLIKEEFGVTSKEDIANIRNRAIEARDILSNVNIRVATVENIRKYAPQVIDKLEKAGLTLERFIKIASAGDAGVLRRWGDSSNIWVYQKNFERRELSERASILGHESLHLAGKLDEVHHYDAFPTRPAPPNNINIWHSLLNKL
jgi:hypothetical protein